MSPLGKLCVAVSKLHPCFVQRTTCVSEAFESKQVIFCWRKNPCALRSVASVREALDFVVFYPLLPSARVDCNKSCAHYVCQKETIAAANNLFTETDRLLRGQKYLKLRVGYRFSVRSRQRFKKGDWNKTDSFLGLAPK